MRLTINKINFSYPGNDAPVLRELSFTAESGSYWCIAGPNGSGKSTLLRLISGLLATESKSGDVLWNDKPLAKWSRIELAREIGFVASGLRASFPVLVEDYVLQGRFA